MAGPGMLYVTMQPKPGLCLDQFHEWYNNEHGPTRLRLPHIFSNGLRYRATDSMEPTFLAAYDVTSMNHLVTPVYTTLRANRSPREAETISQVDVKRDFFDLVYTKQAQDYVPIESLSDEEAEGAVLVQVDVTLTGAPEAEAAVYKWYQEEHFDMLSRVPGFRRSRLFRSSQIEPGVPVKHFALHEYYKTNGLGGPEHKASMSTKWREEVFDKYIANKGRRTYELFYVFGPGPRDLSSLSRLSTQKAFASTDGMTATTPGTGAAISSFVTVRDGLEIPYRLEGNPDPKAPTLAFCNSLLTSLKMWDPLIAILNAKRPEFRILRLDTRGRHALPSPPVPVTLDMVADDLRTILAALRIPKLHALVGVSMGGATTLKFALKYPQLLGKFVACDFNAASSEANTKAWKERIAVAESQPETSDPKSGIKKLAGQTVERWFHPHTMAEKKDTVRWMTEMVAANDIVGFKYGCQALWAYDMKQEMKNCEVPGLLVAGEGDGKGALVKAMEGFKDAIGSSGAQLEVVPQAGHLPMCEDPEAFWTSIKAFL